MEKSTMSERGMPILLGVLAILSLSYGIVGAALDVEREGRILWDLDYYRTAAARWHAGLDPFLTASGPTGFYYAVTTAPLVASIFHDFQGDLLYALLAVVAIAGALLLSVRSVRPAPHVMALCWLYAVALGNAEVVYLLASGNLAWFAGLMQAGALFTASRGRWTLFYLFVGVASLIKPYSLLLLIVPFALGALSVWAVIAFVPLAVDTVLSRILWPDLAASRVTAIWMGVIEPLQLRYSLAGRLSRLLARLELDVAMATLIAVLVQLGVATALVILLRRRRPSDPQRAFALAAVAAFSALPRMAGYDAFVFGPAVFMAFFLGSDSRASRHLTIICALALFAGLLKEGLAILPLLALAALWLSPSAVNGTPDRPMATEDEPVR